MQDNALILPEFAENYNFIIKDSIQGYHWNNRQATIHPFVIYKKNYKNLTHVCLILDHMKHDTNAVHTFLEKVLNLVKIKYPMLQKCVYLSDGDGSHYKNCKAFSNLCHNESDFGLNIEWNFFATFHGKSPCDGDGGTVKCLVGNARLRSLQEPIDTLLKMFEWCRKNISAIEFIFTFAKTNQ